MKAFRIKEEYFFKKIELEVFFQISSNSMSLVCQPLPWQTTSDQIFEQVLYARHEVTQSVFLKMRQVGCDHSYSSQEATEARRG